MIRPIYILFVAFISLTSCSKEEIDPNRFRMEVDLLQGSCGVIKLDISKGKMRQDFRESKCEPNISSEYSTVLPEEQYEKLVRMVEDLQLLNIRRDDCQRCTDGKDVFVKIKMGGQSNQFTLGFTPQKTDEGRYNEFLQFLDDYLIPKSTLEKE
ncbi:hypothetical protein GQF61_08055 [Sphingobacterium sp. DK4209]|uniref:Lipoprotein n=1 Tax=Sphingobacterium zhuxiongii TaxID=2662364 RepID=A0A5Q0Q4A5_9SPHI|nr:MULTISPECIES: hypothetical protein [unclassified Sphingobacterium]MVZ65809.1 hypothetical protein [Sphingobacterium sp. DK4209]QGA24847.1 hypothetical protein GFH32_00220 [Sphingobacterium sp. dk4302]